MSSATRSGLRCGPRRRRRLARATPAAGSTVRGHNLRITMTRPDFQEGLHPQLDCDLVNRRKIEYMTKLEAQNAQLEEDLAKTLGLLREGSGLVMEGQISDITHRTALARIATMDYRGNEHPSAAIAREALGS